MAGNKHCMIIHHIQPLHKSTANSFFLPKYHVKDCDEKGENSNGKRILCIHQGFRESGKVQCWKKVVCIGWPESFILNQVCLFFGFFSPWKHIWIFVSPTQKTPGGNKSCPEVISSQYDQATKHRPFNSGFFSSSKLKIFETLFMSQQWILQWEYLLKKK